MDKHRWEGGKITFIKTIGGIGFWCSLIGLAGIGGAIEYGTGWAASLLFLEAGGICLSIYFDQYKEGGV